MTATQPVPVPPRHRRPILWIALTAVFALAALALAQWGMNLSSQLDTTKSELASTQAQLATAKAEARRKTIAGNVLAVAVGAGVAALQNQLGLEPADGGTAAQALGAAQLRANEAAQALADAKGPVAEARAKLAAASAKSSVAVTCARAAAGVFSSLRDGSRDVRARLATAVQALKTLAPQCKAAFAAT
jgi:hypothetical protein